MCGTKSIRKNVIIRITNNKSNEKILINNDVFMVIVYL
ncbi:hypothetical protein BJV41_005439 [Clostridium beijerinckii]|nr:hypothetical protein [Clostridium beijerinckii]OOM48249.1 hypothetical protein CBEIJ_24280 [Clostridium beijerinckii]